MRTTLAAAAVFVLAMPADSAAHRLDEYLQAARVSLSHDHVTLHVDLTPGANVAPAIVALLDVDRDGTITPVEAHVYGQKVLSDLLLEIDGRAVPMTLTYVATPSIGDMRDGLGTIQLRAAGAFDVGAGARLLRFRNDHQQAMSVYLANALMPDDDGVEVVAQTRDPRQRELRVEYDVGPRWPSQLLWLLLGTAGLATLIIFRT